MYTQYCFLASRGLLRWINNTSLWEHAMRTTDSVGDALAWPFLLPGTLACRAIGVTRHQDLVRMLVNSIFWTVLGVIVAVLAI
jgi:hypothetical protein